MHHLRRILPLHAAMFRSRQRKISGSSDGKVSLFYAYHGGRGSVIRRKANVTDTNKKFQGLLTYLSNLAIGQVCSSSFWIDRWMKKWLI